MVLKTDVLTTEEADLYLTEVLGIQNAKFGMENEDLAFLNHLIQCYGQATPFNNIASLSIDPTKRALPTFEEVKKAMFTGIGGRCYTLCTFMYLLLKALGYKVHLYLSSIMGLPPNHPVIGVMINLKEYLVDVGTGYPFWEAIPLDFDMESQVYAKSCIQFKYKKQHGHILRINIKGNLQENFFYNFETKKVSLDEVNHHLAKVYQYDPDAIYSPLHTSIRILGWYDGKAVGMKNNILMLEDDGKMKATVLETKQDVKHTIKKHFDKFSDEMLDKAIENKAIKWSFK